MAKSIFDIEPHQVSKDLSSYSFLIYGDAKVGKTTLASHFPDPLFLAFERGYSSIPGIMALDIDTWSDAKKALRELKSGKAHDKYKTIVIDTADIAYNLCEEFIIRGYDPGPTGVAPESIGDIPYGQGYKLIEKEFDAFVRSIINMNYGFVAISHSREKVFKDEHKKEYVQIVPTLENKGKLVIERACDIIGYARSVGEDEGKKDVRLFLRGCNRFEAGGRFKCITPSIPMDYNCLMQAVSDAIDKEADEYENKYLTVDRDNSKIILNIQYDFDSLMAEAQDIIQTLVKKDSSYTKKITEIIEGYLGEGKKLTKCNEKQADIVYKIVEELKTI